MKDEEVYEPDPAAPDNLANPTEGGLWRKTE
jgi:hypothetical protein